MFSGKVKAIGISVGILLLSVLASGQSDKKLSYHFGDSLNDTDIVSTIRGVIINYSLSDLSVSGLINSEGSFFRIEAPGHTPTQEMGKPELPVFSRLIRIPENSEIKIRISNVISRKISPSGAGYKGMLYPRQANSAKTQDKLKTEFAIDKTLYNRRGVIESDTVRVELLGRIRGQQLANVYISPVRYNPLKNELEVITSMKIEISFPDSKGTGSSSGMTESALFTESLDKGILNYNPSDVITGYSDKPVRMIILTDTVFKKHLKPYITWKTRKGFRITTLYRGSKLAGTTFTELKDTLSKIYRSATDENPAPEYLLIVGDINIIPRSDGTTQVSDLYYGEFDGNGDYLPDMFIGRLPVTDTSDVKAVVNKLVQYESFQFADTNKFYRRALIAAGGETYPSYITFMNGQINYATTNYLNTANNIDVKSIPVPLPVKPDSVIKSWINRGVSFINYTGHGLVDQWFKPEPSKEYPLLLSSDVAQLTNKNMYPFVISNACQTAHYNDAGSLGNKMILAAEKGAVGFIGCSNDSFWEEDYYWAVGNKVPSGNPPYSSAALGAYDRLFHLNNESPSSWYVTMGQVNYAGNLSVSAGTSLLKKYYWETYTLLGDPSIIPFIGDPANFNIALPDTIPNGIKSLSVTLDPFSYIAISHRDTLWDASYASPSGSVVLDLPGLSNDSCLVVITGQNKIPLIKKIYIGTINKEFINLSASSIDDSGANNNGLADYGESLNLKITVSNLGLSAAEGLYGKLTTTSDWVTIIADSAYIGSLAGRSEIVLTNSFSFKIDRLIPDRGYITINLKLKDTKTEKNYKIDISVHAPALEILSCIIDDSGTGNGDNIADPGETINLVFSVANTGSSNISGLLGVADYPPGLTVNQTAVSTGVIEYGKTRNIPVSVTLSPLMQKGTSFNIHSILNCDPYFTDKIFSVAIGKIRESFEYQTFSIFPWQNASAYPWVITNSSAFEGQFSARSAVIPDKAESTLKLSVNTPKQDTVKFMYKVSSEQDFDFLIFRLNGVQLLKVSGERAWVEKKVVLNEGYNLLEWIYSKDKTLKSGSDCAMIDFITFPSSAFNKVDIKTGKIVTPQPNKNYAYEIISARVINLGTDTLKNYYMGYTINNNPALYQVFNKKINPADSADISFITAANMNGNGTYLIKVFSSGNNDGYIKNDTASLVIINTAVEPVVNQANSIRVMPNPFSESFRILINAEKSDNARISIFDPAGRNVWEENFPLIPGENNLTVTPGKIASGYYSVIIRGKTIYKVARLIKK